MSDATSQTVGTTPEPGAPGWRELRALWPLLLLVALVVGWTELQFASALSAISASAVVAVVAGILKWLPEKTESSAKLSLANSLKSHTLARRLWKTSAVFALGTLLLGSVRVSVGEHAGRTRIYKIDASGASAAKDVSASAQVLDGKNSTKSFLVGLPFGRAARFASTNNDVSVVVKSWPWFVPTLSYPDDFQPLPEVAVLPSPNFRLMIGRGKWLRLLVLTDGAPPELLAEDTLKAYESRMVVFDSARIANDTLVARWSPLAKDSLQLDSSLVAPVVDEWLKSRRLVRSTRLLVPGQQVRVALINQKGDTIRSVRTTLTSGLSNVVLHD
jgi:hypothetical protein